MRLFISAGEPSGDLHGANLARALRLRRPDIEFVGFGGDRMNSAGVCLLYPLTQLAVMWFGRVLANLPTFLHLGAMAESYFRRHRPDAVVLIDYPGFHWHIAQRAHRYGVPVYFFVPPQLWAWAGWRVERVRKHFRAVLTALPFEDEWYRSRGVRTHYVGHPYFDEIANQRLDHDFVAKERSAGDRIIALLPGSRTQEVVANFRSMIEAAKRVAAKHPNVRFLVAAFKPKHAEMAREMLASSGLPATVHCGRTPEIIEVAEMCLSVSGSVSLELMVRRKPTVIIYRVGRLLRFLASRLKKVKYITLVNLLADAEIYPEFASVEDRSAEIAAKLDEWLADAAKLAGVIRALDELNAKVAQPGAVDRAADFLLHDIPGTIH